MTATRLRNTSLAALATLAALTLAGCASMSEPAQSVSLIEPVNGATVSSPFKLRFGVKGMVVAPAGDIVPNSGHHHLVINGEAVPAGQSVPFTERSLHFGKGQTETELSLPPGSYSLTAQFANGAHQSYGKPMSQTIAVIVR